MLTLISKKELNKLQYAMLNKEIVIIKFKNSSTKNLLNYKKIIELIKTNILYYPILRFANHNNTVCHNTYSNNTILQNNNIIKNIKLGNTLIIKDIEIYNKKISTFIKVMKKYFNFKIKINSYFVNKNQKGLNIHFDMHDVLALQLEGRKSWRIYQSKKDVDLSLSIELNLHLLNKKKYQEFCLKKGEAIFIPKGQWHDTFTTNKNSLHCAIGFYPEQMSDLINKKYKNLLYENIYKLREIK